MPGYRVHEYRLIVPLPEALQNKVQSLRDDLHEKHGVKTAWGLKPSLTLLKFFAFEKTEARLLERLQQTAMGQHPLMVEMKDFAAYPSHSVYIPLATKTVFADLVKELKKIKWLMQVPQQDPQFFPEPHLTLAQKLKPMKFISMWMDLEYRQFTGRFCADSLLLLRRSNPDSRYEVLRRMEFLSRGVQVKQGVLFG
jgi:2'-5' RNA ligase